MSVAVIMGSILLKRPKQPLLAGIVFFLFMLVAEHLTGQEWGVDTDIRDCNLNYVSAC